MPRPRKPKNTLPTRAELVAESARLERPLEAPRPWLKDLNRDPRLAAALRRYIERHLLTRS
jgi:hypothetical protein